MKEWRIPQNVAAQFHQKSGTTDDGLNGRYETGTIEYNVQSQ